MIIVSDGAGRFAAEVKSFLALQGALMQALRREQPSVRDWEYLLDCPKRGNLSLDEEPWRFAVHGSGVRFVSACGVVVDVHRAVTRTDLVDAWRFMQYLDSMTEQPTVIWNEAAIESELRALEKAGVLRHIAADRGYVLVTQRV